MPSAAELLELRAAVSSLLGGNWDVQPLGGTSRRTFLAVGSRTLVLRLGARAEVARRLSTLRVSPPVVAAGAIGTEPFVLHESIDASQRIDPAWMRANHEAVGELMRRYLLDAELGELAPRLELQGHAEWLAGALAERDPAREQLAHLLVSSIPGDAEASAAGTHGDPNFTNFLFAERLWLVDWDDLARADPVRDIGQVAWWYLDEDTWPAFAVACGQPPAVVKRIHWWAAVESLDVALRLVDTDAEAAEAFLGDFDAAVTGRMNPRRR